MHVEKQAIQPRGPRQSATIQRPEGRIEPSLCRRAEHDQGRVAYVEAAIAVELAGGRDRVVDSGIGRWALSVGKGREEKSWRVCGLSYCVV